LSEVFLFVKDCFSGTFVFWTLAVQQTISVELG